MSRRNLSPAQRQRLDQDRNDKLDQLHQRLAEQVKKLHHGQGWRDWLTVASKLHRYSWRNSLLIQLQNPDATVVAGYNTWKSLGRQVDKGQKGLQILAPVKRRVEAEQADQEHPLQVTEGDGQEAARCTLRVVGYRVTHCFDISQTSGEPLPTPPRPQLLAGQAPEGLRDPLAEQVTTAGFTLERGDCEGTANGWTDFASRTVRIRDDVDEAQAVKTLAHELAHLRLHDPTHFHGTTAHCRGTAEVEAESVAFLVAGAHGMDTDDYTFPYVATWAASAGDPDQVVAHTAERVVGTAREVIDSAGLVPDTIEAAHAAHTLGRDAAELGQQSHQGNPHAAAAAAVLGHRSAPPTPAMRECCPAHSVERDR